MRKCKLLLTVFRWSMHGTIIYYRYTYRYDVSFHRYVYLLIMSETMKVHQLVCAYCKRDKNFKNIWLIVCLVASCFPSLSRIFAQSIQPYCHSNIYMYPTVPIYSAKPALWPFNKYVRTYSTYKHVCRSLAKLKWNTHNISHTEDRPFNQYNFITIVPQCKYILYWNITVSCDASFYNHANFSVLDKNESSKSLIFIWWIYPLWLRPSLISIADGQRIYVWYSHWSLSLRPMPASRRSPKMH